MVLLLLTDPRLAGGFGVPRLAPRAGSAPKLLSDTCPGTPSEFVFSKFMILRSELELVVELKAEAAAEAAVRDRRIDVLEV